MRSRKEIEESYLFDLPKNKIISELLLDIRDLLINSQDTAVQVGKRVHEPLPDNSAKTVRRKDGGSVRRR